jgi:hypothetical protein
MFKFEKHCPLCHESPSYSFDITYEQMQKWLSDYDTPVHNQFPDLSPKEREVLLTGMCFKCSDRIFTRE